MSVRHSPQWTYGSGMAANKKTVLVINGPNLNLLGQRQPEIYGTATLEDHINRMVEIGSATGLKITAFQSNSSGEIVERIHAARGKEDAIIINAGAFTHYAWSIHDALAAFAGPKIEVHISNPASREEWRQQSVLAPVVHGSIAGFGGLGYDLAVAAVDSLLNI